MTVITDEFGCRRTFVTARKAKRQEVIKCPFCGHSGEFLEYAIGHFKGEGVI